MIFVNLPVADVARSTVFYEAMGATRDPRFCDGSAAMMKFSDTIAFMLISHQRFADFTDKTIIDAHTHVQTLLCFSADSREAVDDTIEQAVRAGGKADPGPKQEYPFMYGRSYEDPDGHVIEVMWMDVEAAVGAMSQSSQEQAAPVSA